MAEAVTEGSPLLTYEDDETEGRRAFIAGKDASCCPWPPNRGGSIRRLAWLRGYYDEKYVKPHQRRRWFE
jgi:hypothetical protein